MKILKENPFLKFTCKGCKSVLKADPEDVLCSLAWESNYCGGDEYFYVLCPICRVEHRIDTAERLLSSELAAKARQAARVAEQNR